MPTEIDTGDVESGTDHLTNATATITEELLILSNRVESELDTHLATVFDAHPLIVNDPSLKEELQAEIRLNLVSANSAVKEQVRRSSVAR